jgi:hypothetical protein
LDIPLGRLPTRFCRHRGCCGCGSRGRWRLRERIREGKKRKKEKKKKAKKDRGITDIILFSINQRSYFTERFTKTDSISPLELLFRSKFNKN